jgi:hypothetical protein
LVWFIIFERLFHWCISIWILFSRHCSRILGLFGLLQSAVHLHSFRFAGGSLTAGDRPHFSENVVCISLFLVWFHHLREIGLSRCISSFNRFDFHHRREIDLVSLYSWFDCISTRDCFMKIDVSYSLAHSLSHGHGHGLVWCNTSAVHFHSFRFAGGSLTAATPPFSENVVFITLWIGLISSSSRDCFMMVLWLYSCVDFISSRDCFIDVLVFESYSLDVHYFMACLM